MSTTTEIATVPLAETSLSDSDHTMLKETFALLHKVDGFQSFSSGIPLESPENLQILIDWDSREHHEVFAASPAYKPWLQRLDKAIDTSKAAFHHVDLQPLGELAKVVVAHVTEITTSFFGDGGPAEKWLHEVDQVVRVMGGEDSLRWYGLAGLAFGITYEEISFRDGGQGKASVVVMGWESEDHRATFRETEVFEAWLGLKGGVEAVEVFEVGFGRSAE